MKNYIKLLRVKHYMKNFLVFLPLVFSGNAFNFDKLVPNILGFLVFCLISSVIYIINDIKDINEDRNHPIKKNRPLASNKISIKKAVWILIVLLILSIIIQTIIVQKYYINFNSFLFIIIYIILNVIYSFGLKNIPVVDILILSLGFIIRVLYGGAITSINISSWLFLTVLSMALYLGLGKRRNELIKNSNSRKVLSEYNKTFLDKTMYMFLGMTLLFYSLWTIGENTFVDNNPIIYSILIIIFIVMRYSLIVEGDSFGDPVDVVTSDKILMFSIIFYLIYIGVVLYV